MKKLLFYASAVAVMFSSCSKDATEDIAVQSGTQVFTASVAVEEQNQTRLHLEGSNFVFDVNDALGVASKENPAANILVSTATCGANPAFSVRTEDYDRWLENTAVKTANPLYIYFPYEVGQSFTADGKITVNIPAAQKYEFQSFYKNSIYAVGHVAEYKGENQEVALKVPHSLIKANVIGWGDMKSISLNINDKNGNPITLNGDYTVDVTKAAPTTEFKTNAGVITKIDLGFKPESLDFNEPLEVNFVVPAGINLSEATLIFTDDKGDTCPVKMPAEASTGKMSLRPGLRVTIGSTVQFGLDDKFLVVDGADYTAEELFLAYAYLAQVQQTGDAAKISSHFATVAKIINSEKPWEMDALILDSVLDFAAYDKAWAQAQKAELDEVLVFDAVNDFWKDVYSWYIANGGAIESIAYNAVLGLENTTIKNLNVVGNGFTVGASLENLTLENITVVAKNADYAGLVAPHSVLTVTPADRPEESMVVKNVVISTGNKVVAENVTYVGGIYGEQTRANNAITAAAAIAIDADDASCSYVGRLYGYVDRDITLTLKDKYAWDASVSSYPVIGYVNAHANVTADIAVSAELKNGGVVGKVYGVQGDNYASSVIVEGVSYWNGDIVWGAAPTMAVDADGVVTDPFTAEDLAAVITTDAFSSTYFLTHDIDMQCDHVVWGADVLDPMGVQPEFSLWPSLSGSRTIKLDGKNHTISNASITGNGVGYVSLFGCEAELKDVKVANLIVNTSAAATNNIFAVAGLAYSGKAQNVSVENVIVNVADELSFANAGVAAIFSVADIKTDIKDVTVKNCSIVSDKAVTAGIVAGVLNVSGKTSTIEGITVEGTNSVKTAAGAMNKAKGLINTNYVAPKAYAYTAPFGIVNVTDAAFTASGTVTHTLTVSKSSYGSVFAAGYTFANASAAKKDVVLSKTTFSVADLEKYDYAFMSNANVDNYFNNIAFVK